MFLSKQVIHGDEPVTVSDELAILAGEVYQLSQDWDTFEVVFLNSSEATGEWRRMAPEFLEQLLKLLLTRLVGGVTRLTDRLATMGRYNLVLQRLFLGKPAPPQLDELLKLKEKFVPHRNKLVAHLSLDCALNLGTELDSQFTLGDIRKAVQLMREVIHAASEAELDGGWLPTKGIPVGQELVNCLKMSQMYKRLEDAKIIPEGLWDFPPEMAERYFSERPDV